MTLDADLELLTLARRASLLHDHRHIPGAKRRACPQCEPDGCMLDDWSRELLQLPPRHSLADARHQQPTRPDWMCNTCRQPWPCPPARVELGEAYIDDPVGLLVLTSRLLILAAAETTVPVDELRERFVAWTAAVI